MFAGGCLQYSAVNDYDYSGRFSTAAGQAYSIDTNGQTVTWAAPLTSAGGSLTKLGSGMLIIGVWTNRHGQETYTGATDIEDGTLRTGYDYVLPAGTTVALGNAAADTSGVLDVNGTGQEFAGLYNASGSTSGVTSGDSGGVLTLNVSGEDDFSGSLTDSSQYSLQLVKQGCGTLTLSGSNSYSGGTIVSAGTLQLGDGTTDGSITSDITDNAALVFDNVAAPIYAGVISGSGAVTIIGNGTLSGDSSGFAGTTCVQSGSLDLEGPLGGTLTVAGGARVVGADSPLQTTIAGLSTGTAGTPVELTASATDAIAASPSDLTFAWQETDAGGNVLASASGTNFSFTPASAGTYTVTLAATDSDATSPAVTFAFVADNPPPAIAGLTLADVTGTPNADGSPTTTDPTLSGSIAGSGDAIADVPWSSIGAPRATRSRRTTPPPAADLDRRQRRFQLLARGAFRKPPMR